MRLTLQITRAKVLSPKSANQRWSLRRGYRSPESHPSCKCWWEGVQAIVQRKFESELAFRSNPAQSRRVLPRSGSGIPICRSRTILPSLKLHLGDALIAFRYRRDSRCRDETVDRHK